MSRGTRIALWLCALALASLVVLGIAATASLGRLARGNLSRYMVTDPATVDAIGQAIAAFEPPPGYVPEGAIRLLGFALAAYDPNDEQSTLVLLQVPRWLPVSDEQLARFLRENLLSGDQTEEESVAVLEEQEIRVGDHTILYVVFEGVGDAGEPYRALQTLFPGRNGSVMLFLEEPLSRWNEARVQDLLASLR
jgi:hypothetical protein